MLAVFADALFAAISARWLGGILIGLLILTAYLSVSHWSRWRHWRKRAALRPSGWRTDSRATS